MKTALLIVDVQHDYFEGGAMPLRGMENAAINCQRLLQYFRGVHLPVFHVRHLSEYAGATLFIPQTRGCEIHERVRPGANETLISKHFPNAFRGTSLDESLRVVGATQLVVCGAMSQMCIDSTVRAAFDLGYSCALISDACAAGDLAFGGKTVAAADVHACFMAALNGVFATVLDTQRYLVG